MKKQCAEYEPGTCPCCHPEYKTSRQQRKERDNWKHGVVELRAAIAKAKGE